MINNMANNVEPRKTIFIRNLPDDVDNNSLEDVFSDVGPVRRCFVVTEKESGKSRGIGFVTFSTFEDAKEALENIKTVNGQSVLTEYAKKRDTEKRKKGGQRDDDESADDDEETKPAPSKKPKKFQAPLDPIKCRVTLNGLPLNATERQIEIAAKAAKVQGLQCINWPESGIPSEKTAVLVFEKKGQAIIATQNFNKCGFKGKKITATHGQIAQVSQASKASRLIIRNLSFKCNEENLKEKFQKFGKILEVKIPLKPDGKMKGFGFVQYTCTDDAQAALEMNAQQIFNRPVAVDWCVAKDKFVKANVVSVKDKSKSVKSETTEEENKITKKKDKKEKDKKGKDKGGLKIYNYGEGMISDGEEESEEEAEIEDEEDSDESEEEEMEMSDEDESDEDKDESEEENEEESEDESEDEEVSEEEEEPKKKKKKGGKSDTEEGRTLFVRNLSFESEEEDMYELFSELGDVIYSRITMNNETGKSRGTGFVQYASKEDADKCLEVANDPGPSGGLMLDDRELKVSVALSKDKIGKVVEQRKEKEKEKPDKRNLHLAREGLIRAGTKDAEGVSEADMTKRQRLQMVFRTKLKNDNIFISPTRMCVHNLPTTIEGPSLKKLIFRHLREDYAKITECRIMRDMNRLNPSGVGKSRGYAFVNFDKHEHALKALRLLNNNPNVFTDEKRPIVEFSLENSLVLTAKAKRVDRSKAKSEALTTGGKGVYADAKKEKERKKQEASKVVVPSPTSGAEVVEEVQKKKKGLPSHWGPKIRHKTRVSQVVVKKPKDRKSRTEIKKQETTSTVSAKKTKKNGTRKRSAANSDDLDVLIGKYKNSISSSIKAKKKTTESKWFD